ncbi:MAG: murein biosynthesis integral membrane protein MurJ [Hydrogenobaculum sp.]
MIFKNALFFSIAVFISRILGYIRDAVFAYYFGVSYLSDAFFIAWRLPNTLRRLLGEGGLNASFVPIYGELYKKDEELSNRFFSGVFWYLAFINLVIITLTILFAPYVVKIIAPGITNPLAVEKAAFFIRFLIVNQMFFSINALLMGALNVKGVFFRSAFTQAIFNISMIIFIVVFEHSFGIFSAVIGALVGGISQVVFLFLKAVKLNIKLSFCFKLTEHIKTFFKRLIPALLGFGVAQLSFFVDTFLASMLGKGVISYMYYANRLFQLPIGLMSVGLANALLSSLSLGEDKTKRTSEALALISIFTIPASFGLFSLSKDIINLLYHHGLFNEKDALNTAHVLAILSLGITFFSWQKILSSAFFANKDTLSPSLSTLIGVLVEGTSGYTFAFLMHLSFIGLAMGTVLSGLSSFLFLTWRSKGNFIDLKMLISSCLKALVGAFLMCIFILYFKKLVPYPWLRIAIFIPAGALVYLLFLFLLRETFVISIFKSLKKKTVM